MLLHSPMLVVIKKCILNLCIFLSTIRVLDYNIKTNHQKEGVKMILTKSKRVISLILVFVMIFSIVPAFAISEEGDLAGYTDAEKKSRDIYLHAQGENPNSTPNLSTIYLGDEFKLYFAVDDPNKGDYENEMGQVALKKEAVGGKKNG